MTSLCHHHRRLLLHRCRLRPLLLREAAFVEVDSLAPRTTAAAANLCRGRDRPRLPLFALFSRRTAAPERSSHPDLAAACRPNGAQTI